MDTIRVESDEAAADIVANMGLGARELRDLASNAGVSRERGDTKRQTAQRIVMQDPALASRLMENDSEVPIDASAFSRRRHVGSETIPPEEGVRRARYAKMERRLGELRRSVPHCYETSLSWEATGAARNDRIGTGYEPGLTSVRIRPEVDMAHGVSGRALIMFNPRGALKRADITNGTYNSDMLEGNEGQPNIAWRLTLEAVADLYCP